MSYTENAKILKSQIDANQKTVNLVNEVGGIRDEWAQSDRLGFDWHNYYIDNKLYRQDYVQQEYPYPGSKDSPFEWTADLLLITNGFYTHDVTRKVWTGPTGVAASWDDAGWEVL